MDDGTRISPEAERFLRMARAKDVSGCVSMLQADPSLLMAEEAGGYSALHFAAFNGDIPMLEMLIERKPDLNHTNYDGNTPLTMAAKGRQPGAIRLLVGAGAAINHKTSTGATALHHAATMEDLSIVELLIELGAALETAPSECGSVLHWACHSDVPNVAGYLIFRYGMDINLRDVHGGTPLFVALHLHRSEVAQFLLQYGANPNLAAVDGTTPLHLASHGTLDDVKTLLAFGANPNATDSEGKTPVQLAQEKGLTQSVKEMLKPQTEKEKRLADAARFKAQGNKVFADGESHKAAKFYGLAISLDPTNHIYFSNRSACYFNVGNYAAAYFDACRCVQLDPTFVRGFFRKAATLNALNRKADAVAAIAQGLKIDPKNADLLTLKEEIAKK